MPVVSASEIERCMRVYRKLESVSGHGIVPYVDLRERFPGIRLYTFLRDPLQRCASDYQFRVTNGGLKMSFDEWIETPVARNRQTVHLCGREDADLARAILAKEVGFVGLTERFNRSLVLFQRWCGESRVDIRYRPKNVTRNSRIKRELLTNLQTRRKLIEANREDIRLYEHAVRYVYPQQEEAYGPHLDRDVEAFEAFNIPRPVYPRQLPSLLLRELVYKPLVPFLSESENPLGIPLPRSVRQARIHSPPRSRAA